MTMAVKKPAPTSERLLQLQVEAAKVIVAQIAESGMADDSDLIRDMVEGETDLQSAIEKVVESIVLEDQAALEGIAKAETYLRDRKGRIETRVERKKAMILTALQISEQKKVKTPLKTVSIRAVPPKLEVTDEASIPSGYWKQPDPVLDRKSLGDHLKARAALIREAMEIEDAEARAAKLAMIEETSPPVPGAELSNGSETVAFY